MLVHNNGPTYAPVRRMPAIIGAGPVLRRLGPGRIGGYAPPRRSRGKGRQHACAAFFAVDHPVTFPARVGIPFSPDLAGPTANPWALTIGAATSVERARPVAQFSTDRRPAEPSNSGSSAASASDPGTCDPSWNRVHKFSKFLLAASAKPVRLIRCSIQR